MADDGRHGRTSGDGSGQRRADERSTSQTTSREWSSRAKPERSTIETVYCRECGERIRKEAELCPHCGVRQYEPAGAKNAAVALLLSFFIAGLGQIYNGEVGKGILLAVTEVVLVMIVVVTIWFLIGFLFVPLWLLVWGYAMYDAYVTAEAINRGTYRQ